MHLSLLGHAVFLATVVGSKNGHIQSVKIIIIQSYKTINNSMLNKALTILVNRIVWHPATFPSYHTVYGHIPYSSIYAIQLLFLDYRIQYCDG